MAVNVRYLQKQGLDSATTIGGVGISMLAAGAMHIALTAVSLVWAGSKSSIADLPSSTTILLALVVVAAIIGLAVMIRPARRLIRTTVVPQVEGGPRAARGPGRGQLRQGALHQHLPGVLQRALAAHPLRGLSGPGQRRRRVS